MAVAVAVRVHSLLREKKCVRQNQRSKVPNHDRNTFEQNRNSSSSTFQQKVDCGTYDGAIRTLQNDNPASKPSNGCADRLRHGDCVVRVLVLLLRQRRSVFRMNEL